MSSRIREKPNILQVLEEEGLELKSRGNACYTLLQHTESLRG